MILRSAKDEDCDLFFRLRTDPEALRASRRPAITREEHRRWWINTSDHRWVIDADGGPVGTIRLGWDGMVSIIVASGLRGHGIGTAALRLLRIEARKLGFSRVWAEVAPENQQSQRAFLRAGWAPILLETAV